MATADSIRLVADILSANPARKICVVSAPGRTHGCIKMTDLLVHDYIQVCAERTVMLVNGLGLTSRTANVALSQLFHLEERGSVALCDHRQADG
jgi:aspartokinase